MDQYDSHRPIHTQNTLSTADRVFSTSNVKRFQAFIRSKETENEAAIATYENIIDFGKWLSQQVQDKGANKGNPYAANTIKSYITR